MKKYIFIICILVLTLSAHFFLKSSQNCLYPKSYEISHINTLLPEHKILLGQKLNINKIDLYDLSILPGIGRKIAQRVIETKNRRGGFKTKEDIMSVSGIGHGKYAKIRHLIDIK